MSASPPRHRKAPPIPPLPGLEVEADEVVFGQRFAMQRVRFRHARFDGSPSGTLTWELWRRGRGVVILPWDPVSDRVALIEQFRLPAHAAGLSPVQTELPAGLLEADEDPAEAASRELAEETGLVSRAFAPIGAFLLMPGGCDEVVHFFCAAVELSAPRPDAWPGPGERGTRVSWWGGGRLPHVAGNGWMARHRARAALAATATARGCARNGHDRARPSALSPRLHAAIARPAQRRAGERGRAAGPHRVVRPQRGQPGDGGCCGGTAARPPSARRSRARPARSAWVAPAPGPPPVGAEVEVALDWARRHRHMRMHTTMHLLCSVLPGIYATGNQIGAEKSRLDFDLPSRRRRNGSPSG
jgi:ADP-ribose pyrophosphatase